MTDTFETLRPYLGDYLRQRGINPQKRFRCLNPAHLDRNPSMGYDPRREKVHCFACGADYDLFDLLALEENLPTPADALRRASQLYGHGTPQGEVPRGEEKQTETGRRPARKPARPEGETNYIRRCAERAGDTPYFARRGLSPETVNRFRLGYDPE